MSTLLEDRFYIRSVDTSKFEKVGRLKAKSLGFDIEMQLDVNIDVFPVRERESISVGFAQHTSEDTSIGASMDQSLQSLMDCYNCVMYGRIFNIEEVGNNRRTVYASFGGLLMSLSADKEVLGKLELNMRVFILLKHEGNV
eukprot:GHVO01058264.1.p2 GENE.GHVO01058264.1~~GHVO01058264.1.p2  ORF type:complete len:141 (+),score=28.84 GHVO01058264.1:100-522(+)